MVNEIRVKRGVRKMPASIPKKLLATTPVRVPEAMVTKT